MGVSKLANRNYISKEVAPQIINDLRVQQRNLLSSAKNINVLMDGWTDVSKINYLAVILKFDVEKKGGCYEYIGNLEIADRHSAENMFKATKTILEGLIDYKQIISINSDNARSMVLWKDKCIEEFPSASSIPCCLHIVPSIKQTGICVYPVLFLLQI